MALFSRGAETSVRQRAVIYSYIGLLYLIFPFNGVWGTSAIFYLKDHLHLQADQLATFLFYANVPGYLGFVFGCVRDRWNPLGRRDQGLLILFSSGAALLLLCGAILPPTYTLLVTIFILGGITAQFVSSALQGLTSVIGRQHLMTGRLASLWQAAAAIPSIFASVIAGYLATNLRIQNTFWVATSIAFFVAAFTFWRPREVYDIAEESPTEPRHLLTDVMAILKTRELYPIILLLFL